MASRANTLDTIREDAVEQRPFSTQYYNLDIHRAAMALPEFVKQALK